MGGAQVARYARDSIRLLCGVETAVEIQPANESSRQSRQVARLSSLPRALPPSRPPAPIYTSLPLSSVRALSGLHVNECVGMYRLTVCTLRTRRSAPALPVLAEMGELAARRRLKHTKQARVRWWHAALALCSARKKVEKRYRTASM